MEFTQDHIAAIIGAKEMEIIGLRLQCSALTAERDALKAKYEPAPEAKPDLKAVP
jgi:hypothetical protein